MQGWFRSEAMVPRKRIPQRTRSALFQKTALSDRRKSSFRRNLFGHQPKPVHTGTLRCVDELRHVIEKQFIVGLKKHRPVIASLENILKPLDEACRLHFVLIDFDYSIPIYA